MSRRFSTKSDSKRFITLFSGSGGMTSPGLDSTIAARLASLGSLDLEQAALRLGADAD